MRRLIAIALACAPMLSGAAAYAQSPSLIRPKGMVMELDAARNKDLQRRAMNQWAECSLKSRRASALAFLDLFPGSKAAHDRVRSVADYDCIGAGYIQYTESLFRGALYQVLYEEDYANVPPGDVAMLASPDYAFGGNPMSSEDKSTIAVRRYIDCIARSDPQAAHALLLSTPGTSVEDGAFSALSPGLSGCLAKGDTLSFSKSILRGTLAEVMYRIRHDAIPAAASSKKSEG